MGAIQSNGQVMGGWLPGRLAKLTPAAALIAGLAPRDGRGGVPPTPDRIDQHLRRMRERAESAAHLRLQDFAAGR